MKMCMWHVLYLSKLKKKCYVYIALKMISLQTEIAVLREQKQNEFGVFRKLKLNCESIVIL